MVSESWLHSPKSATATGGCESGWPQELLRYLVYKGSIAIDGISLTIASVEADTIGVAIIPHTYEATSLGELTTGSKVNLECDVIAKHVERLMQSVEFEPRSGLTVDELKEQGF